MNIYIEGLNNKSEPNHELLEEMREYATTFNVPIIKRDSLVLIQGALYQMKAKKVLEIGTAIGYSAISFCLYNKDIKVDTIERNKEMYDKAKFYINKAGLENQINVIFGDALEIDNKILAEYDMIFIDAAKAQYQKFFDKYSPLLKEDGVIFSDNILFHGCVENQDELSKNLKSMVKKIDAYNHYLDCINDYQTFFLDCGDGLAITIKKK